MYRDCIWSIAQAYATWCQTTKADFAAVRFFYEVLARKD